VTAIYLDACCLNRPFDNQTQDRIRLESETVLIVLRHIESGEWQWVISDALLFEISQDPDEARRRRIVMIMKIAKRRVVIQEAERARASHRHSGVSGV
jgi:hypothetical protein